MILLILANNIILNIQIATWLHQWTKEKGKWFKRNSGYTNTITWQSDWIKSMEHDVTIIHHFFHHNTAIECRNTQFINVIRKLKVQLAWVDNFYLESERNWIPMAFDSTCTIYQWCNEILACCEPKCSWKGNMMIYWDEQGEQVPKETRCAMMGSACEKMKSRYEVIEGHRIKWKRANRGWEALAGIEEFQCQQRRVHMSRGASKQSLQDGLLCKSANPGRGESWWRLRSANPRGRAWNRRESTWNKIKRQKSRTRIAGADRVTPIHILEHSTRGFWSAEWNKGVAIQTQEPHQGFEEHRWGLRGIYSSGGGMIGGYGVLKDIKECQSGTRGLRCTYPIGGVTKEEQLRMKWNREEPGQGAPMWVEGCLFYLSSTKGAVWSGPLLCDWWGRWLPEWTLSQGMHTIDFNIHHEKTQR